MARTTQRKSDTVVDVPLHAVPDEIVVPMFPELSGDPTEPGRIDIDRVTPADGYLSSTSEVREVTPSWLRDTFGGGIYELKLYAKSGALLANRRLKIAGDPIPKQQLETQRQAAKDEQAQAESAAALQTRLFREHIELLKQEQEAQRQRARMELEISMQRLSRESEEREERERRRHERDMERERERNAQERAREREALQAQQAMNQAFMASIQSLNKEQTTMMMALLQNNSKTDPLEAAVKINSMVESRLELQQGDPEQKQAEQMWGLIGKGMDMIGNGQKSTAGQVAAGAASGLAKTAAQQVRAPSRLSAQGARPNPQAPQDDLPIPQVIKQRLASILKKITDAGMDPVLILKDLDDGELAIVPTDEYQKGQQARAELGHPMDDDDADEQDGPDEQPEPGPTPGVARGARTKRPGSDGPAVEPDQASHGGPPAEGARGESDAQPGSTPA